MLVKISRIRTRFRDGKPDSGASAVAQVRVAGSRMWPCAYPSARRFRVAGMNFGRALVLMFLERFCSYILVNKEYY